MAVRPATCTARPTRAATKKVFWGRDPDGGRVALVGANLGDGSTLETATLGFKLMTGCSVTTAGSVIECDVPAGAGENIEVRVQVDGALSQDDNELFSYGAPTVLSASSVPSTGGLVTVTGTNFAARTRVGFMHAPQRGL